MEKDWHKRTAALALAVLFMLTCVLTGCGNSGGKDKSGGQDAVQNTDPGTGDGGTETAAVQNTESQEEEPAETPLTAEGGETMLKLFVNGEKLSVEWENNESVDALAQLASEETLTIGMSMYGGFEQVGSIGETLPRNDEQTTTQTGDIVLYSGNQIVVFYGSNTWAYTRLGRITDRTDAELAELLGNGDAELKIEAAR